MADMELVIRIDEEDFEIMKHNVVVNNPLCPLSQEEMVSKVANGTPLPKDHGRIGDLDVLREEVSSWGMNDYEPSDFIDAIDQADTIIEADKEVGP